MIIFVRSLTKMLDSLTLVHLIEKDTLICLFSFLYSEIKVSPAQSSQKKVHFKALYCATCGDARFRIPGRNKHT